MATYTDDDSRPDSSAEFDPTDRDAVLKQFRRHWGLARSHWSDWRDEARDLYDMVSGRQWSDEDVARMNDEKRPIVTFNVAGKYMDAVQGLQINNRQETRFFPRELGDAQMNELLTGAVAWARDTCDQADEETDAFYDCILTGMGWVECHLDKDLDSDGVPAGRRIDPLQMFGDPAAHRRNMTDGRFVIRLKDMDHDEYEELFGDDDYGTDESFDGLFDDDDGIEIIEEPQDYDKTPGSSSETTKRKKCLVADYQYWCRETRYLMTAPGQPEREMDEQEYEAYQPFLKKMADVAQQTGRPFPVQISKIKKRVYYRAFVANDRIAENGFGLSPYQEGFTYHPMTGKRDRNKRVWFGLGRAVLDPQRWLNKFFSTILYALMTNAKGGILAERNAFENPVKAETEWANPASITWLKPGALTAERGKAIEPKPQAKYPEGLDRLMEFTLGVLPQTSGLNLELLGLADRVQAGVVEAQRKQSAMAIIAWAFDAMRRYYRSIGRQQARYIIDYMPEGKLVLINGEQTKQYVPLLKQGLNFKFDVIVDEAPTSTNMKERVWMVLENIIPQLLKMGLAIPPEVLDYSPLPTELAQKWKEVMKPDPQKQQLAQAKEIAELEKTKGQAADEAAAAELSRAKAAETMANIGQNGEGAKAEAEIRKAEIKAQVDMAVAELNAKIDLMVERMKIEMQERVKEKEIAVGAVVERERIAADADRPDQD